MTAFYTNLRDQVAGPLIREYGVEVTLRKVTTRSYDPEQGSVTHEPPQDTTLHAVRLSRGVTGADPEYFQDDLFSRADDVLLIEADGEHAPEVGDTILLDGKALRIVEVKATQPGGVEITYRVGLAGF